VRVRRTDGRWVDTEVGAQLVGFGITDIVLRARDIQNPEFQAWFDEFIVPRVVDLKWLPR
jgi:hypothetical protein